MNSFIFVGFAIIRITFAARVLTAQHSGDQDVLGDPADQVDLVDVTQDVIKVEEEASGSDTLRCCCDTVSGRLSSIFDKYPRSGRCQIFTQKSAFKCGKVERPAWLKHDGYLKHFVSASDKRCLLPEAEAEQFYKTYGTADNYCSSFKVDETFAGAAALGKDTTVACGAGYKPQVEYVTCMWKSVQEGIFDPQPECIRDEEWCPTIEITQVLTVAATQLGAASPVTCMPGFVPVHAESTCTPDRTFKPTPECEPISDYCQFQPYRTGPTVQPAAKNEWVPVQCPLGFAPSSQMTQCIEGGIFEPQPSCNTIWEFCQGITTKPEYGQLISPGPTVDAAALGNRELVRCRMGWEAHPAEVKCTESGYFDQEPKCLKDWSWCSAYEENDVYVSSAGRDDLQTVRCAHRDYKPAMDYVKCDKNRQFKPTPKCVLK